MNSVQFDEMTAGSDLPPFLITNPYLEDMSIMTENTIPLLPHKDQSATKFCHKCSTVKPVSEFYKATGKKDGLQTRCIICSKEYGKKYHGANGAILREKHREYYKVNVVRIKAKRSLPEEKLAQQKRNKRYYQEHAVEMRAYAERYRKEIRDPVAAKQYNKEYYKKNKTSISAKCKEYQEKNKEKLSAKKKAYASKPEVRDRINAWHKEYRKTNPKFRLNANIHKAISTSLVGAKKGRSWEAIVGYDIEDLRGHLEKQFTDGMSWDNYGEWHVDHKIPLAVHNFISPDDIDFKRAWALSNLQPMWGHDNRVKHTTIDKPFQPSLAFGGAI
jgi:hypothetical protein